MATKVTPDIAAIYVKYIKKNCKPNDNDMFDLLDSEGNVVKMFYSNILRISKQSQHEHNKREIEGLTISAEMQLRQIQDKVNQIAEDIEGIKYEAQRIEDIAKEITSIIIKPKKTKSILSPFKTIKPRSK